MELDVQEHNGYMEYNVNIVAPWFCSLGLLFSTCVCLADSIGETSVFFVSIPYRKNIISVICGYQVPYDFLK